MTIIKIIFFSTLIFSLSNSCAHQNGERMELLNEVSTLEADLKMAQSKLLQNKIDTISEFNVSMSSVLLRIKNNLIQSEIDTELNRKLNAYKVAGKNLTQNQRNYLKAQKACKEEKESLLNLRHDIENGLGNFEKYKDYIQFEKNKTSTIKKLIDSYVKEKNKNIITITKLHPELYAFSMSILK